MNPTTKSPLHAKDKNIPHELVTNRISRFSDNDVSEKSERGLVQVAEEVYDSMLRSQL